MVMVNNSPVMRRVVMMIAGHLVLIGMNVTVPQSIHYYLELDSMLLTVSDAVI